MFTANMIVYKVSGYREVLGRLIELLTKSKRRPSFPDLLERHVLGDDGWKDTDKVMMVRIAKSCNRVTSLYK